MLVFHTPDNIVKALIYRSMYKQLVRQALLQTFLNPKITRLHHSW